MGAFLTAAGCLDICLLGRSGRSESRLLSSLLSKADNLASITMARCDVSAAEDTAAAAGRSIAQSIIHAGVFSCQHMVHTNLSGSTELQLLLLHCAGNMFEVESQSMQEIAWLGVL